MRVIGLDLGTRTLGVAMSDPSMFLASPVMTIRFKDEDYQDALQQLDELAKSHGVKTLCLGYPKHMNNTIGDAAKRSIAFQELLESLGYEVVLMDERLSTRQAQASMIASKSSKAKRKSDIDQGAAVVILQTYLDQRRSV